MPPDLVRGQGDGPDTFERDNYIFGALNAGASGFLLKRTCAEKLLAAIHTIAVGDALLSPSVTRRVIDRMASQPAAERPYDERLADLTPREREVLTQVARGLSNTEIAEELVIEESTVKTPRQTDPHEAPPARLRPGRDLRRQERARASGIAPVRSS